ncbi:hypothetical protein I548_3531 [Mycobacterium intracellulare]|nr:hypothetical protein I548_3531 [Mycobacterium intracellulare]
MARLVGVAVAQHVDRPGPEMIRMGGQVAHVGLGVTAGSVQQNQHRLAGVPGPQVAGPYSSGVEVALLKRDALEIAPDALELRHGPVRPPDRGNLVLVFDVLRVLISHTNVRYI